MSAQPAVLRHLDAPTRDYNHADDGEYKRLRDLAEQEYKLKTKYSQESQDAYHLGDHAEAKRLSDLSKKHDAKMDDYNAQAAVWVFRANNADSAADEIDLHGLYITEAIEILKARINACRSRNDSHLKVIVGKGIHSENHVAKLKPAVEDLCREQNIPYNVEAGNFGVLKLRFSQNQQQQQYPQQHTYPQQYQQHTQPQNYQQQQQQQSLSGPVDICCSILKAIFKAIS